MNEKKDDDGEGLEEKIPWATARWFVYIGGGFASAVALGMLAYLVWAWLQTYPEITTLAERPTAARTDSQVAWDYYRNRNVCIEWRRFAERRAASAQTTDGLWTVLLAVTAALSSGAALVARAIKERPRRHLVQFVVLLLGFLAGVLSAHRGYAQLQSNERKELIKTAGVLAASENQTRVDQDPPREPSARTVYFRALNAKLVTGCLEHRPSLANSYPIETDAIERRMVELLRNFRPESPRGAEAAAVARRISELAASYVHTGEECVNLPEVSPSTASSTVNIDVTARCRWVLIAWSQWANISVQSGVVSDTQLPLGQRPGAVSTEIETEDAAVLRACGLGSHDASLRLSLMPRDASAAETMRDNAVLRIRACESLRRSPTERRAYDAGPEP